MQIGSPPSSARQSGVLYLGLLFFIALMGLSLSSMGVIWSTERQREREAELIATGEEIREAIRSYYESSPGTVKRFPRNLDSLVVDDRFLVVRRHIRKLRPDPMTERVDWTLLRATDGGVMGVASQSDKRAIKVFGVSGRASIGQNRYRDWEFVYIPSL